MPRNGHTSPEQFYLDLLCLQIQFCLLSVTYISYACSNNNKVSSPHITNRLILVLNKYLEKKAKKKYFRNRKRALIHILFIEHLHVHMHTYSDQNICMYICILILISTSQYLTHSRPCQWPTGADQTVCMIGYYESYHDWWG